MNALFDLRTDVKVANRFWARVTGGDYTTCWQWGGRISRGYGKLRINNTEIRAHRYAYEALVGPIPNNSVIDHLCRNRACVNPWHMEPVPSRINTLRGMGPTAVNGRKDRCPQGHIYASNGYRGADGWHCRPCRRAAARARYAASRRAVAS